MKGWELGLNYRKFPLSLSGLTLYRNIGAPELVTGSRDGTVKVWDVRIRDKPVACMQVCAAHESHVFLMSSLDGKFTTVKLAQNKMLFEKFLIWVSQH